VALGTVWAFAAVMMTGGWLWQMRRNNAGIVDVLWAVGLGCSAVFLAFTGAGAPIPRVLLGVFGALWGLRLASHIFKRVTHEAEDGRYRYLRTHWKGDQRLFFLFFQFQALLIVLFSIPFLPARDNAETLLPWLIAAGAIWVGSVAGEAIADRQLRQFRANPAHRGRTCQVGLWHYSRHPNYFFEWLHWFSYVALAVGAPRFALSLVGPVLMFVFLRWVSGIPFTEKQALRTRGEEYRQYQASTPMLFPWFPRKSGAAAHERMGR
jgi:steroid 5-alpha reductase family enzyme